MIIVKKAQQQQHADMMGGTRAGAYMMMHPDNLGDLMHAVLLEQTIDMNAKRDVLERMARDTGYAPPQTPLTSNVLSNLGDGILGTVVSGMLSGNGRIGLPGINALGRVISNYYLDEDQQNNTGILL
jgi:hypothetical protein